mmetsp:Transcript_16088/g.26109  ORF Transcript_16088/g.26109 Transcript_16088/m.26109 type:complete len:119 (-) Transcript_16088:868-1224(-)
MGNAARTMKMLAEIPVAKTKLLNVRSELQASEERLAKMQKSVRQREELSQQQLRNLVHDNTESIKRLEKALDDKVKEILKRREEAYNNAVQEAMAEADKQTAARIAAKKAAEKKDPAQ